MPAGTGYSALAGGSPRPAVIQGTSGVTGARQLTTRNPDASENLQRSVIFQAMGKLPESPRMLFTSARVRAIQEIRKRAREIQELARG
jgi:hypothetical protein